LRKGKQKPSRPKTARLNSSLVPRRDVLTQINAWDVRAAHHLERIEGNGDDMRSDILPKLTQFTSPVEWWKWSHQQQLLLCDELEHIADSLPHRFNPGQCTSISEALGPMIRNFHVYEEMVIVPHIRAAWLPHPPFEDVFARLHHEHIED
jgi:hypothetical protein